MVFFLYEWVDNFECKGEQNILRHNWHLSGIYVWLDQFWSRKLVFTETKFVTDRGTYYLIIFQDDNYVLSIRLLIFSSVSSSITWCRTWFVALLLFTWFFSCMNELMVLSWMANRISWGTNDIYVLLDQFWSRTLVFTQTNYVTMNRYLLLGYISGSQVCFTHKTFDFLQ